jgi:hypothetical protein
VLAQLDLHNTRNTHLDQTGQPFVIDDAPSPRKRRSVTRDVHRMRRFFSGTAATGTTARGVCVCVCVCLLLVPPLHNLLITFSTPLTPLAGVPIHHSLVGASRVLYLDFTGMTITGTAWNDWRAVASWTALPFDTDGNTSSFSASERQVISRVWNRMAEDFAPFGVDVTTEPPAAFGSNVGRLLITRTTDANGIFLPGGENAGGIAYVGVFNNTWNR